MSIELQKSIETIFPFFLQNEISLQAIALMQTQSHLWSSSVAVKNMFAVEKVKVTRRFISSSSLYRSLISDDIVNAHKRLTD